MTVKKSFFLRAAAFVTAVILIFVTFIVTRPNSYAADEGEGGQSYEYDLPSDAVVDFSMSAGGKELSPGEINEITENSFRFNLTWDLSGKDGQMTIAPGTTLYLDLSTKLGDFKLPEQTIGSNDTIEYKIVTRNGTSHLEITIKDGHLDHSGSCEFKGELDLSKINDFDKNITVGGFAEKSYTLDISGLKPKDPTLEVYKNAENADSSIDPNAICGKIYKNGDHYYIDYTVTVTSRNGDVSGVVLYETLEGGFGRIVADSIRTSTDNWNWDWENAYLDGNNNIKINSTLTKDKSVIVKYSVQLDAATPDDVTQLSAYVNTVYASNGTVTSDNSQSRIDIQGASVSKSGSLLADGKTIEWTIRIYPGSGKGAGTSFEFTDKISDLVDPNGEYSALFDGNGKLKSTVNAVWNNDHYEITYKTELTEDAQAKKNDFEVKNEITNVTVAGESVDDTSASVWVRKKDPIEVEKKAVEYKKIDNAEDRLKWQIKIRIPDSGTITGYSFDDYINDWSIDWNSSGVDFDPTSLEYYISTTGELDSSARKIQPAGDEFSERYGTSPSWSINKADENLLAELDQHRGDYLIIVYELKIPDSASVETFPNHFSVNMSFDDNGDKFTSSGSADDVYSDMTYNYSKEVNNYDAGSYYSSKTPIPGTYDYPVECFIGISGAGYFELGKSITIEDTIPSGYEYYAVEGVYPYNDYSTMSEGYKNYFDKAFIPVTDVRREGNTVTFTFTIPTDFYEKVGFTSPDTGICIKYYAVMKEGEFKRVVEKEGGQATYKNTADVTYEGHTAEHVEADYDIVIDDKEIVTKYGVEDTNQRVTDGSDNDNLISSVINYTIEINPNKFQLSNNGEITAVDTLGGKLTLKDKTVVIIADGVQILDSEAEKMYTYSDNKITFTLRDKVYYKITYSVDVAPVYVDEEQTDSWVSNTLEVIGSNNASYSDASIQSWSNFKSSFSHRFSTTDITITINKIWQTEANDTSVHSIKVELSREKGTKQADGTIVWSGETEQYTADNFTNPVTFSAKANETEKWVDCIKFENLPVIDPDGVTYYRYFISEIEADGDSISSDSFKYTVEYNNQSNNQSSAVEISSSITIKNIVKTDVTITKKWEGGEKPNNTDISGFLKLYRKIGDGVREEVENVTPERNGDEYVFKNLPMYNESGILYIYEVDEVDPDSAAGQVKIGDKTYTVKVEGLTITNEYEEPAPETIDVKVTKKWQDKAGNSLSTYPESVTVHLFKQAGEAPNSSNDTPILPADVTLNAGNNWTYKWEGLEKDAVYYVTEDEDSVDGYSTKIEPANSSGGKYDFTVTNTLITGKIKLRKLDIANSNDIAGAVISIYEASYTENDEPVIKWTSDGSGAQEFELKPGTYVIKEATPPKGYGVVETTIKFTVKNDGSVEFGSYTTNGGIEVEADNTVVFKDEQIDDIKLIKTYSDKTFDGMSNEAINAFLTGTEFTLTDVTGGTSKFVAKAKPEWKNGRAEVAFSGVVLLEANHTYELEETTVPGGYANSKVFICKVDAKGDVSYSIKGSTESAELTGDGFPACENNKITVELIKVYNGRDLKQEIEEAASSGKDITSVVNVWLSGTKFTLTDITNGSSEVVATASPEWNPETERAEVTFAGEYLKANRKYRLAETSSSKGYVKSSVSFTCTVDENGAVSYINESTNTSVDIPTCENALDVTGKDDGNIIIGITKKWYNEATGSGSAPSGVTSIKVNVKYNGKSIDTEDIIISKDNGWEFSKEYSLSAFEGVNTISDFKKDLLKVTEGDTSGYEFDAKIGETSWSELFSTASVEIKNTYSEAAPVIVPDNIKLIKQYSDGENISEEVLENTKFALFSDPGCDDEHKISNDVEVEKGTGADSGKYVVIFDKDEMNGNKLEINRTYYLKETVSPEGYDKNTTIFSCEVQSDGTVKYGIYGTPSGTGDNADGTFPVCVNVKKSSTPSGSGGSNTDDSPEGPNTDDGSDGSTTNGGSDSSNTNDNSGGSTTYDSSDGSDNSGNSGSSESSPSLSPVISVSSDSSSSKKSEDVSSGARMYGESGIESGNGVKAAAIASSLMIIAVFTIGAVKRRQK